MKKRERGSYKVGLKKYQTFVIIPKAKYNNLICHMVFSVKFNSKPYPLLTMKKYLLAIENNTVENISKGKFCQMQSPFIMASLPFIYPVGKSREIMDYLKLSPLIIWIINLKDVSEKLISFLDLIT